MTPIPEARILQTCCLPRKTTRWPRFETADSFASGGRTLEQKYFCFAGYISEGTACSFCEAMAARRPSKPIEKAGKFFPGHDRWRKPIVVRDQKSEVRGFYNVCRHRGTRLKEDECGHSSTIQCPYHAWTYALDGRLIGAPHMDDVPGFDKADYSLHRVNLGLWEGFIFVNLGDASTERGSYRSLEEWFAPLNGKFSHWNMSILQPAKRIEYDVRANWKLIFENYSECYHCPACIRLQKFRPMIRRRTICAKGRFSAGS